MIRTLIVDDHAMLREGIRALLSIQKDIEVIGEASDGKEAMEKTVALQPDVVLLDIGMPGMDGLEAARQIKKIKPDVKILILTQHDNREYILSAIKAGVSGYVPKRVLSAELITAIYAVQAGEPFLYPDAALALIKDYRQQTVKEPYDLLTDREKEILKMVVSGSTYKSVGERLNLSLKTVQGHVGRIKEKLGINNRSELIRFSIRRGIVPLDEKK